MCLVEGSLEYTTSTCRMCTVLKEVYRKKSNAVCPHKTSMRICRRRENHPRGADIVHHTNAEIRNFNGCGYCKWADAHPDLAKRGLLSNDGWPGCCRAPTQNEYQQYIRPEDWAAVSHLYKLSRSSTSRPDDASTTPRSSNVSRDDLSASVQAMNLNGSSTPKQRVSNSAAVSAPSPRSMKSTGSAQRVTVASGQRSSLKPSPPPTSFDDSPPTPPGRSVAGSVISSNSKDPSSSSSSSSSGLSISLTPTSKRGSDPSTPKRLADPSSPTSPRSTRDITVVRYVPSDFDAAPPSATTSRRQTIAVQTQSSFYRNSGSRASLNGALEDLVPPPPSVAAQPPIVEVVPLSSRELPQRFGSNAKHPGAGIGNGHPTSGATNGTGWPSPTSSSSSSSSSSSASSSFSAPPSRHPHQRTPSSGSSSSSSSSSTSSSSSSGSTARLSTSSSDFTDFLSDDSDYEMQREAEERAAEMQRLRVERAEEREWRDARARLRDLDVEIELGGGGAPSNGGGDRMGTVGRRGTVLGR